MRRGRCPQAIALGQDTIGRETRQPPHGFGIGFLRKPRLDRLPVIAIERAGKRGGEHGLADAGIGAGDDDRLRHESRLIFSASASNRSAITLSVRFAVSAIRSRAVPSATVGGRIAPTSNPPCCHAPASPPALPPAPT